MFRDSRLKIERAEKHIKELYNHIRTFLDSDCYALSVEKHPQTGEDCLQFRMTKSLPDDFALCIGDAIHNFRSALDIAVSRIVFDSTGKFSKHTKFPFRESPKELADTMNGGTIRKASVEIADLIENVIKPYPGGNDALCALHELDILDKHRLLIPMINATTLIGVHVHDDKGPVISGGMWAITGTRQDGGFIPIQHAGNLHIKDKGKTAFQVYFERGMPFEGAAIYQTLLDFKKLVDGIIDIFEAVYIPKG